MLIVKIKKIFEKINFSDNFLTGTVHCAPLQSEFLIFFSKFQNINLWKVSKKSEGPQGMLILLSKSENRGISYPMCTVRRPKIFWQIDPLPKGVQCCKSQENR